MRVECPARRRGPGCRGATRTRARPARGAGAGRVGGGLRLRRALLRARPDRQLRRRAPAGARPRGVRRGRGGSGREVTRLAVGQRVSLEPGVPDFACAQCLAGRYNLCTDMRFYATPPIDGAFAELVTTHELFAHPVPDTLSDDAAALLEPLSVALWACRKGRCPAARGCWSPAPVRSACVAVQVARACGAAEVVDHRRQPAPAGARRRPRRHRRALDVGYDIGRSDRARSPTSCWSARATPAPPRTRSALVAPPGRVVLVGMGGERACRCRSAGSRSASSTVTGHLPLRPHLAGRDRAGCVRAGRARPAGHRPLRPRPGRGRPHRRPHRRHHDQAGRSGQDNDDGAEPPAGAGPDHTGSLVPTYDRAGVRSGIVHFGVGGFHRAHQAMYVDALMNAGKALDWGITGVGLLPGDRRMHEVLHAQDCLYTLVVKDADGTMHPRVIGSIVDYLFAPDDPEAVLADGRPGDPDRVADHHRGRLPRQPGDRRVRRQRPRHPGRPQAGPAHRPPRSATSPRRWRAGGRRGSSRSP